MFTMKLHIDTTAQRVAFAESTKDAVDYLVSLLESPAVSFLGLDIWDSCVDNIYDSAEDLEDAAAAACPGAGEKKLLLPVQLQRPARLRRVRDRDERRHVPVLRLPDGYGSVQWHAGCRSTTLTRMRTLFLRDISAAAVEEKTVQLGHKECMAIAEAALRSRTVLTDVFLGNNKAPQSSPPPSDA
ncbi:hypothetical protein PR202_gb26404 [Eleusine coracana subsp. coracana]|uniref:Uncharacterized protein n=1 Tax=Eleusine coracana subsp. coracana TaxID=191504 RepID=A0AAV5FRR7_ELECO|nr:hypothetical protein PR202_gb26404 [Eleusine coracana subsp. coracana]